jgi:hypothetical protein
LDNGQALTQLCSASAPISSAVNPRGKHVVGLLAEFRWPATIMLGVRDSVTG